MNFVLAKLPLPQPRRVCTYLDPYLEVMWNISNATITQDIESFPRHIGLQFFDLIYIVMDVSASPL